MTTALSNIMEYLELLHAGSEAVYGENALIHGMNVSFLYMTIGALVLVAISVFGTRKIQ